MTQEERAARMAIIRDGRRAGLAWTQIAAGLGISVDSLMQWLAKAQTLSCIPRVPRMCLCCRKSFLSEGAHNRLCQPCALHQDVSPMAPNPGGQTGRQVRAARQ